MVMSAPSVDVKDLLESESVLALTFGTDLFIGEIPPEPNECVVVFDTGGSPSEPHYTYERPTVQIRVRGERGGYVVAYDLINAVRNTLNGQSNVSVNTSRYVGIWQQGDVSFVAWDDNQRPLFTVNFRLHRTDA
jgi:hypothetical protein